MAEWLLGSLLVLILLLKLLDYFDLVDVFDLLGGIVRLVSAVLIGVASLTVWASRKLLGKDGNEANTG